MRIFGRNDVFLLGGLAIALWVVSSRQLGTLLDRAREMERLVQFGQALAHSLDGDSIRAATTEHLPLISSGREAWAITRFSGEWIELTAIEQGKRGAIERAAARAM